MEKMMIKALPFIILPFVVIVLSMFIKTWTAGEPIITCPSLIIGFLLSFFIGLPLHEVIADIVNNHSQGKFAITVDF
ncbi:hypothetical protein INP51_09020 [Blautia liquoris]|uniref:Uncharacterized protein n=1 Tax=Blautia liquoris TaxID=2779518 RepID=A0A7M2RDY5_9FIRM|nr:hypothetical protein [Blautia liquoris]QOV18184.1 hypothetical protein INP51_09020 [Blautia liquoris]